jgi:hypothetical protein
MSNFEEMAKAMSEKQTLSTEQEISQLQGQKKLYDAEIDKMLAVLNQKKVKEDAIKSQIKFEQKERQIQADLLKSAIDDQAKSGTAIGGNLVDGFAPEVEPGAENLPLIDQMG